MKFKCLPGCGLCCHYKVYLLPDDVERIKRVIKNDNFWIKDSVQEDRVAGYLKRRKGFCIFLNEKRLCSIYPQRPLYCRLYPFIKEVYFHSEIDVDLSCPGLDYGREICPSQPGEILGEELNPRVSSSLGDKIKNTVGKIEGLLKQRGCYTSKDLCLFIAKHLIQASLKEGIEKGIFLFRERINLYSSLMKKIGNITRIEQAQKLMGEVLKKQIFSQKDISLPKFFKKEFNQSLLDTRIDEGKVMVYAIRFSPESMKWTFFDTSQSVEFSKLKEIKIDKTGINLLIEYMRFWMRRQLPFRLAYSYALIDFRARNYLFFYLEFLADVLLRVYFLSKVIAVKEKKKEASISEVKEAIRASDSVLRNRCQTKIKIEEKSSG